MVNWHLFASFESSSCFSLSSRAVLVVVELLIVVGLRCIWIIFLHILNLNFIMIDNILTISVVVLLFAPILSRIRSQLSPVVTILILIIVE